MMDGTTGLGPIPLEDLLRLSDDGGPAHDHDAEAPRVVTEDEMQDCYQFGTVDVQQTIADQVRATPVLTYWGTTERGYSVFRQPNGVGGHRYWSDEIGGGVVVWDTSLASRETLEWCIDLEKLLEAEARAKELQEVQAKATSWGAAYGVRGTELKHLNSIIYHLRGKLGFKQ